MSHARLIIKAGLRYNLGAMPAESSVRDVCMAKHLIENRPRPKILNVSLSLAALFLFLAGFLWYATDWYESRVIADEKARVEREIAPYGQDLANQVQRRVSPLNAITAFSASNMNNPDFESSFQGFSAGLFYNVNGLKALEVAPDMVIRYIYPIEGNEAAMNLNLLTDPRKNVRDDTKTTISVKKAALFGPYDLIQGGKGIVAREPIYNPDKTLWGLSTVVMLIDPIFADAHTGNISDYLRTGVKDSAGRVLYGSEQAFSTDSITYEIAVPNGKWVLAARPKVGWSALAAPRVSLAFWAGAAVVFLLLLIFVIIAANRQTLAYSVWARTRELENMNRLYAVLSGLNAAISRTGDRSDLFNSISRIVVEEGRFAMSWIGVVDKATDEIIPVTRFGRTEGFFDDLKISSRGAPEEQGPIASAIRRGKLIVSDDIEHDPTTAPWKKRALDLGFKAGAAIPFFDRGKIAGAMMIYADSPGIFTSDMMSLLVEIESSLTFGLNHLADIADRKAAEEAVINALNDTELKVKERTAELVVANERLQELDRLKSIFIATMSHELRTPLNSIIGFSSILLNEWVGPLSDEQKQNISTVLRSGKHLLALVNDIIDISKIEAGKVPIAITKFTLADAIKEVDDMLRHDAEEKKLLLNIDVEDTEMVTDRRRFIQCVTNLISNAIKFTETGGITVAAGPGAGEQVQVRVSDTGIGIQKKDLARLFKPFERIETPDHEQPPGTGLGLYLSKKIIETILLGTVTAESDGAHGSVFTMTVRGKREDLETGG